MKRVRVYGRKMKEHAERRWEGTTKRRQRPIGGGEVGVRAFNGDLEVMISQNLTQKILGSNEAAGPTMQEEAEGLTLVDNRIGFNKLSWPAMIWNN